MGFEKSNIITREREKPNQIKIRQKDNTYIQTTRNIKKTHLKGFERLRHLSHKVVYTLERVEIMKFGKNGVREREEEYLDVNCKQLKELRQDIKRLQEK